jgi:hypothetical protein
MSVNYDEDDFKKKFQDIVESTDLSKISEEFEVELNFGTKELLLVQQSLSDAVSNIAEILLGRNDGCFDIVFGEDSIHHNLICALYKVSEDFNEAMSEYYNDFEEIDLEFESDEQEGEE